MRIVDINNDSIIKYFNCGEECLNDYLKESALKSHLLKINRTKIIENEGIVIAFVTLNLIEVFEETNREKQFGIYISHLGVSKNYQGKGLGAYLVDYVINETQHFSEFVGIRFVIVDVLKEKVKWYEHSGFIALQENNDFLENTVRMKFDFLNL